MFGTIIAWGTDNSKWEFKLIFSYSPVDKFHVIMI